MQKDLTPQQLAEVPKPEPTKKVKLESQLAKTSEIQATESIS